MKALVVYESMFGNTEAVARAVAEGVGETMDVSLHEVSTAPAPITDLVDLVVVGGPTHAFSLSRPSTRADAIDKGATQGEADTGLREWIGHLRKGPHSECVAAFDTRVDRVRRLPGSAARKAVQAAAGRRLLVGRHGELLRLGRLRAAAARRDRARRGVGPPAR